MLAEYGAGLRGNVPRATIGCYLNCIPPSVYPGFDSLLYILDSVKHFSGLGRYTDTFEKNRFFILASIGLVLYL